MDSWIKIPYKKSGVEGVRYSRKTIDKPHYIIARTERVPEHVKEELEFKDKVDTPEVTKPCLFCDSQATMQRYCNMVMVDLCEYHYYNRNIGKIAEQMRKEKERHGNDPKVPKISKQKKQPQTA